MANFTLKTVHVGDTITPQSIPADRLTTRQADIYNANKSAKVRVVKILSPDSPESKKGIMSAASGKVGKKTWWVQYHRIHQETVDGKIIDKEDPQDRFLSNHDLVTYFGYIIPGISTGGVKTVRVF